MLHALLQKANDPIPTVAGNVLMCLGELACVGGEDAMPHVPELMQVIISRLSDSSLAKRDAALHTLGQVCSSTGYVIAPLVDHPQLLQLLGRILMTESTQAIKREVVKVLGILGALDPYRRKVLALNMFIVALFNDYIARANQKMTLLMKLLLPPSTPSPLPTTPQPWLLTTIIRRSLSQRCWLY
jgi:hypothetical protein